MSRLLVAFLVTMFVLAAPLSQAALHPATKAERSIVRIIALHAEEGLEAYSTVCTGFFVAPKKVLTAYHCTSDAMWADKKPLFIVKVDEERDLALGIVDLTKPTLAIRSTPIVRYETVYGVGYAWGFMQAWTTFHKVLLFKFSPGDGIYPGNWLSGEFFGGMSGGPVVDAMGRVVMIAQRGNYAAGYGVDAATIADFLKVGGGD